MSELALACSILNVLSGLAVACRNLNVLREQLHAETARANRAEQGIVNMRDMEERVSAVEHELQQWQSASDTQSSDQLQKVLDELHQRADDAKQQIAGLEGQLSAAKGELPSSCQPLNALQWQSSVPGRA